MSSAVLPQPQHDDDDIPELVAEDNEPTVVSISMRELQHEVNRLANETRDGTLLHALFSESYARYIARLWQGGSSSSDDREAIAQRQEQLRRDLPSGFFTAPGMLTRLEAERARIRAETPDLAEQNRQVRETAARVQARMADPARGYRNITRLETPWLRESFEMVAPPPPRESAAWRNSSRDPEIGEEDDDEEDQMPELVDNNPPPLPSQQQQPLPSSRRVPVLGEGGAPMRLPNGETAWVELGMDGRMLGTNLSREDQERLCLNVRGGLVPPQQHAQPAIRIRNSVFVPPHQYAAGVPPPRHAVPSHEPFFDAKIACEESRTILPHEEECLVCMNRAVTCILSPCLHKVVCKECANQLAARTRFDEQVRCPVCRAGVDGANAWRKAVAAVK